MSIQPGDFETRSEKKESQLELNKRSYDSPLWQEVLNLYVDWNPYFLKKLKLIFSEEEISKVVNKPFYAMGQKITYKQSSIENDEDKLSILLELQDLWEAYGWKLFELYENVLEKQFNERKLISNNLQRLENTDSLESSHLNDDNNNVDISRSNNNKFTRSQPIVIDGPNVVRTHGKKDENGHVPGRAELLEIMLRQLQDEYGFSNFRVVLSSPFQAYIDDKNLKTRLLDRKIAVTTPAGKDDDFYAIQIARRINGLIITNDRYKDYRVDDEMDNWIETHTITFSYDEQARFFIFDEKLREFSAF